MKIYISKPAILTGIGNEKDIINASLNNKTSLHKESFLNKEFMVSKIKEKLEKIPNSFDSSMHSRTNEIALNTVLKIKDEINKTIKKYGKENIGVVVATTTSGVDENFKIFKKGEFDRSKFEIEKNALYNPSEFIKTLFDLNNVSYTISTACTSGLKAINEGVNLIKSGICKAAIVGGVDSLNALTLFGFDSLSILSDEKCMPFSKDRKGTNLGEGACFMLLDKEQVSPFLIKSFSSNCDAFHITTPRNDGFFQAKLIKDALKTANLNEVDYINLHATGTLANDEMESNAINLTLPNTPASGIKQIIGHTLGAAGAIEIGICLELLSEENILPFHNIEKIDENLPKFNLLKTPIKNKIKNAMSLSFAFGGDNAAMIVGLEK